MELALLTDFLPEFSSSLVLKIKKYTQDQNLTYWVRDQPAPVRGEAQVRFVPEDSMLRLDYSTIYLYVPELISAAFFERLERGRVTSVAFMPGTDLEDELTKRGYEVIWEKHARDKDQLVVVQFDFLNKKTLQLFEERAELPRFHPNKLKPSDALNKFTEANRNRILVLDYDMFADTQHEQFRAEMQELSKEKYSWVVLLSDQPPEAIASQAWCDDICVVCTQGAFRSYGEWTTLRDEAVSVRLLLRAAVQIRSYQKGPIDYMLVCVRPDKEWAFEEMLEMRAFNKNYFKRASPLLVEMGRDRETSLAHFYLDNWEALLWLVERVNLKARGFR